MLVKDASPAQIGHHLASCQTCQDDQVLSLRRGQLRGEIDIFMRSYLAIKVDERIEELHHGYI